MTIAAMRATLGLGPEFSDAAVAERYAIFLGAASDTPSQSEPPITVAEAKLQLRVDIDADDTLIQRLIDAAVETVERDTGLVLSRRQVVEYLPRFGKWMELRSSPVVSVDAVLYRDGTGQTALLPDGGWLNVGARPLRLYPVAGRAWPNRAMEGLGAIEVTLTAGYSGAEDVPATVIQALHVMVADWYRNREAGALSADADRAVRRLLRPFIQRRL